MKLFENKVGRPSNETLKKRKMFYVGIAASVFLVILLLTLALSSLSTVKLTGTTATFSVNEKVNLPEKTTKYLLKNGKLGVGKLEAREYYVRAVYNERGFNRVKLSKTSKGVAIYWVDASDIEKISSPTPNPTTSDYQIGDVNRDGALTEEDAKLILTFYSGEDIFDSQQKQLADMNKDGVITATDASEVLSKAPILVNFSTPTATLGKTTSHKVTLRTPDDTFEVTTSKPKIVSIDRKDATSFVLRALDSGTSVITVKSKKTGITITYNYTVPEYELPSTDRFGKALNNIKSRGKVNGIPVYAEKSCKTNIVNKYIWNIIKLKGYVAKTIKAVYIVSPETMAVAHTSIAGGITIPTHGTGGFDSYGYGVIDIPCGEYKDYVLFHEAAHAVDFRYKSYYSRFASEDFEQLMINNNPGPNKEPQYLRKYSYSNYAEFFADSYAMYLGSKEWVTNDEINEKIEQKMKEIKNIGW